MSNHCLLKMIAVPLMLLILSPQQGLTQSRGLSLSGQLRDADTGHPIHYANIILSGTTLGTTSLKDGRFQINRLRPGRYTLVINMMGYATVRKSILLIKKSLPLATIWLKPQAVQGEAVEITGRPPRWWKYHLNIFKSAFLGQSEFSSKCTLINPEVLSFKDSTDGTFYAWAEAPLEIENRALGYQLTLWIYDFRWTERDRLVSAFDVLFSPLESQNNQQLRRWEKSRDDAYRGSAMHFFRSMAARQARAEGFTLYGLDWLPNSRNRELEKKGLLIPGRLDPDTLVSHGQYNFEARLHLPRYTRVLFKKKHWEELSIASNLLYNPQPDASLYPTSHVALECTPLTVLRNGLPALEANPAAYPFTFSGVWQHQRVADMLPANYQPQQNHTLHYIPMFTNSDSTTVPLYADSLNAESAATCLFGRSGRDLIIDWASPLPTKNDEPPGGNITFQLQGQLTLMDVSGKALLKRKMAVDRNTLQQFSLDSKYLSSEISAPLNETAVRWEFILSDDIQKKTARFNGTVPQNMGSGTQRVSGIRTLQSLDMKVTMSPFDRVVPRTLFMMRPYPFKTISRNSTLHYYFEFMEIKTPSPKNKHVLITVETQPTGSLWRNIFGKKDAFCFERSCVSNILPIHFALEHRDRPPGRYRILVTVTDLKTLEKTDASRLIHIKECP